MHQAYHVHSILKQGVHIESIAAYDNNVILGTRSGQLIMYSVDKNGAVDMLMFSKNFSKKSIVQMEVIAEENLLFVLTDSMIHVCDISRTENNFTFIHSSAFTKGCSLFTLDAQTTKTTTGKTTTVIRVCCAIKRRLQFFYWKLNTLAYPECSVELKDIPKSLCWVEDLVCIGYKSEYVLYNIKDNKMENLIVTSSSHNLEPSICLLKDDILGISKDEFLVAINLQNYKETKDDKKVQVSIEATGGKATTPLKPMIWSSHPLDLVWDEPFVIGRVANGLEIRCLESNGIDKDTLVQTIPELNKIKHLVRSANGTIFAAAISELWCIRLVDIPTQRQQLLQQKRFQLAIELTNISDEPEQSKAETIRQIHMRYAKELFALKQFSAAMTEFEHAQANPYDVIRLFPNLLQDQSKSSTSTDSYDAAVPTAAMLQLEDKDLENALLALIEFLALARQKEVVKLRDTKSNSKSLLSIIDTTLLKCYLQTNDSLIAPLLRLNQCHLEESEKTLLKHDKISELIILYQTNGKHKKALELLQSQATKEGSSLYGYERTIRYLQQLGSSHWNLIMEFSDWVLKANPEQGLRIFTEDFIEVENLPRASVLDFLLTHHKALVIPYLEHVINVWQDTNTFIHNILIKQYREKLENIMQDLQKESSNGKKELEQELKEYRKKLYDLLENSDNYSPDVVLKDFPTNILLEERALILGRLKKHEKVLAIYIQILGDVEKACKYCEDNYEDDNDIFFNLLMTILNPMQQPPYEDVELHKDFLKPNNEIVLELLNKYALKIEPGKIWPYLPKDLPLYRLQYYLDTVLRQQMATRSELEIKRGLLEARLKRVTEQVLEQQRIHFELTEFSVCPECKKRFANQSAFVRYPNGDVVHLSCHDKRVMADKLFGN